MNYLPFVAIIIILLFILFLLIKPIIEDRPKKIVYDNDINLYFNKLINHELKLISNNTIENDLLSGENYRSEIVSILNKNQDYVTSSLEEQQFILLAKKREQIVRRIKELDSMLYLNQISRHDYEVDRANLNSLLKKTEIEITPYIA